MIKTKFRIIVSYVFIFLAFFFIPTLFAEEKLDMDTTLSNHDPGTNPGTANSTPAADQVQATTAGIGDGGKTIEGTVKVNTSLNVRTGAWGTVIGSLHNGDKVSIIGTSGDWYQITYKGQTAFIHRNYVDTPDCKAGTVPVKQPANSGNTDSHNTDSLSTTPVTTGNGRFGGAPFSPLPSAASSEFGPRNMFGSTFHYGIDLPTPNGTKLNALGDGVVEDVGFEAAGGNYVLIKYDNGLESFYCHLQRGTVTKGQRVNMGQQVALSDTTGSHVTGPHLHMGIKKNGAYVNPRSIQGLQLPGK
ncbi:MAG: peptidoglycan DD-metalloendopeptidase family protein [Candidatus Riflebacteria bacterium]|nr:peptidoglycan DD-metalloendopeptidase family protein [Candidatus Riflebacteria bacterium]